MVNDKWLMAECLHVLQTNLQRIHPVRNADTESLLDLGLVQYGISRTNDWTGKLMAVAGLDVTLRMPRQGSNHLREVIPRAYSFVTEVIDTVLAVALLWLFLYIVFEHSMDDLCQVVGISRRSCLVEHHLQLGLGSRQVQHGFHEVPAELTVQPGRAEDHVVAARSQYVLFPLQLGASVHTGRRTLLVFLARRVVRISTKHVVRRDMHQQSAHFLHGLRQVAGSVSVQHTAESLVILRLVHVGIGRAVHDALHAPFPYDTAYSFQISDVEQRRFHAFRLHHIRKHKCM